MHALSLWGPSRLGSASAMDTSRSAQVDLDDHFLSPSLHASFWRMQASTVNQSADGAFLKSHAADGGGHRHSRTPLEVDCQMACCPSAISRSAMTQAFNGGLIPAQMSEYSTAWHSLWIWQQQALQP